MKTSYPDTPLTPVNKQAATLLASVEGELKDTPFYLGLKEEAKAIDKSIVSMQAQIASHRGEANAWLRQCEYSLALAKRHRKAVQHVIGEIAGLSKQILETRRIQEAERANARAAAERSERRHAQLVREQLVALAREQKYAASNNSCQQFSTALKAVLQEEFGLEIYTQLVQKAVQRTQEQNQNVCPS
jgi:chromosome segregation ATPase